MDEFKQEIIGIEDIVAKGSIIQGRAEVMSQGLSPFGQNESAYLKDAFDVAASPQDKGISAPKLRFLEEREQKGSTVIQNIESDSLQMSMKVFRPENKSTRNTLLDVKRSSLAPKYRKNDEESSR